ncbi:MAG: RagB/SusD family nutrient uptake outer membrane protein [Dysgonamonadaceae bacterium]|jgi:hypothetical protein|nr:RagB/SusD family nutrient uptake outer membrane protein [Dysgonamonadaceae bacterium]
MKRFKLISVILGVLFVSACSDFLDITPNDRISDDGIWSSPNAIKQYINDVYNSINGPLYIWSSRNNRDNIGGARAIFDCFMTGDLWYHSGRLYNYTQWNKSSSMDALNRWTDCYTNIRKVNTAIDNLNETTVLGTEFKERYLGDMYFWRAMLYYELFRFYGKTPIIDHAQNRHEEDIFNARDKEIDVVNFFISDFENAAKRLPVNIPNSELGRATKGAALGMLSTAYLHLAGVMPHVEDLSTLPFDPKEYYRLSYEIADLFITGTKASDETIEKFGITDRNMLVGKYNLFGKNAADKTQAFQDLFYAANEYNEEVIFDIQFTDKFPQSWESSERRGHDLMGISHPGSYAENTDGSYGGWGNNNPTQNLVDAFRMADGSPFDWNNPQHAANPYENREPRFYASILYNGCPWRGDTLYTSTNLVVKHPTRPQYQFPTNPQKRGTANYGDTGYYLRKLIDPSKRGGTPCRYAPWEGADQNLIVLRYAEILLTYAEAKLEYDRNADQSIYDALNAVRDRGGLRALSGLDYPALQTQIRNERHIELCFENKRYFDIMRWRKGPEIIGQDVYGIDITYSAENNGQSDAKVITTYNRVLLTPKSFEDPKNYLMPIPDAIAGRNPKLLPDNTGW